MQFELRKRGKSQPNQKQKIFFEKNALDKKPNSLLNFLNRIEENNQFIKTNLQDFDVIIENVEEISLLNYSCFSQEKETQQNRFDDNINRDATSNQKIEITKDFLDQNNQKESLKESSFIDNLQDIGTPQYIMVSNEFDGKMYIPQKADDSCILISGLDLIEGELEEREVSQNEISQLSIKEQLNELCPFKFKQQEYNGLQNDSSFNKIKEFLQLDPSQSVYFGSSNQCATIKEEEKESCSDLNYSNYFKNKSKNFILNLNLSQCFKKIIKSSIVYDYQLKNEENENIESFSINEKGSKCLDIVNSSYQNSKQIDYSSISFKKFKENLFDQINSKNCNANQINNVDFILKQKIKTSHENINEENYQESFQQQLPLIVSKSSDAYEKNSLSVLKQSFKFTCQENCQYQILQSIQKGLKSYQILKELSQQDINQSPIKNSGLYKLKSDLIKKEDLSISEQNFEKRNSEKYQNDKDQVRYSNSVSSGDQNENHSEKNYPEISLKDESRSLTQNSSSFQYSPEDQQSAESRICLIQNEALQQISALIILKNFQKSKFNKEISIIKKENEILKNEKIDDLNQIQELQQMQKIILNELKNEKNQNEFQANLINNHRIEKEREKKKFFDQLNYQNRQILCLKARLHEKKKQNFNIHQSIPKKLQLKNIESKVPNCQDFNLDYISVNEFSQIQELEQQKYIYGYPHSLQNTLDLARGTSIEALNLIEQKKHVLFQAFLIIVAVFSFLFILQKN